MPDSSESGFLRIQAALAYHFDENGQEFLAGKPCFAEEMDLSWILGSRVNSHLIRC